MRIECFKYEDNSSSYSVYGDEYEQEQYDYVFKHLDFNKLAKDCFLQFADNDTEEWFNTIYTKHLYLDHIEDLSLEELCNTVYRKHLYLDHIEDLSPRGYRWLKRNWGKGKFKLNNIFYLDKQELKTIVNRVINVELKRRK